VEMSVATMNKQRLSSVGAACFPIPFFICRPNGAVFSPLIYFY
jgi:hypothetical protein